MVVFLCFLLLKTLRNPSQQKRRRRLDWSWIPSPFGGFSSARRRSKVMATVGGSGSGGQGGQGGRKGHPGVDNWDKHNPNSPKRVDLTAEEYRELRINLFRRHGVPKQELTIRLDSETQGPIIDPIIKESKGLLKLWFMKRHEFIYIMLFGKKSNQSDGDMDGIIKVIEESIRPRVEELANRVIALGGIPMRPPRFYELPLERGRLPFDLVISEKGKGKGKGKAKK